MANLKNLVKDTAIYGLSSIVGRFLNYLLVPLYTNVIPADNGGYGVVTNIYAHTALMLVVLTFGMETTYFRYVNKGGEDRPDTVFSTALGMVSVLSIAFIAFIFGFITPLSTWMGYVSHPEYLELMAVVVGLDAIQAIPFCLLRYQNRPIKFASLKLLFIIMNIGLNLLYFLVMGGRDILLIFVLNLICTAIITFFFIPEFCKINWHFDKALLRRMLRYSWPILVLGIAGILNQTFDKQAFLMIYDQEDAKVQLGIYGACVKIAMIMAMITQAFRYAYEPFVFGHAKDKDSKETYALTMKYFIIFTLLAFLCVMGYIDILKLIIGKSYHVGLKVVPIVMMAEIMMGIYFNLSFWYKLIDKTIYGALFSAIGCGVLIAVNVVFVPKYGYMACAWGGFAGYGVAMILSYIVGQHINPIPYPLKGIFGFILLASVLFGLMCFTANIIDNQWIRMGVNTLFIGIYIAMLYIKR
ncbi:MAG: polysaccharide biosynthesis protein [Prevotellaceae bacterium]|nr:polysaccharide biosynthesis protein [Candidatus Colivivens equi]MCQ2077611.1 oligosaccharide flippase family protein [Bacteroidaceae bacterium]